MSQSMIQKVAGVLKNYLIDAEFQIIDGDAENLAWLAISAMREPTEEMVEIGFVVEQASENNPATYDDPISLVAYKAMISAALSEDGRVHP